MPRGFPLQDEGPGMKQMFHDLTIEQEEARERGEPEPFPQGEPCQTCGGMGEVSRMTMDGWDTDQCPHCLGSGKENHEEA